MAEYDAVIEIPRGSRNKYEIDHETGRVFLDRVLFTSFVYPADYGFFENTLGEDGDPVDVLVLLDHPTFPGVGIKVRPVGVLRMTDDGGGDDKIIAVQYKDPRWQHIQDLNDIPEATRAEIEHFFVHYKDTEPNKWARIDGWGDAAEADKIVQAGFAKLKAEGH
ncbi:MULTISPECIES: inorganic diphosphatase [unclassified Plantibacter]|uniref:inorganic diphosphatase n=1 Tax=unclassified Plantibacter TaxID=2624265 RepID=UPI003D338CA4